MTTPADPRFPRRSRAAFAAALLAALVALLVFAARRGPSAPAAPATRPAEERAANDPMPSSEPAAATPPAKPARAAASTAASAAAPVRVNVRAEPRNAALTLDGVALATGEYAGTHQRDGRSHELGVSAPGYRARTLPITFDHDIDLAVGLAELAPAEVATTKARDAKTTARRAAPAPAPLGTKELYGTDFGPPKPARAAPLDTSSPW